MRSIPFSGPDITENELQAVLEVIRSGWLAHGKYSNRLEELFCEFTKTKYAITVSNCTAGLHLSCLAAGFGPGDEVIVPAQTHTATAHAVEYSGAKVIFADVHPVTGNILLEEIQAKLSPRTKGVIPVHMAGLPCELDKLVSFTMEKGLALIEDCAHSLGSTYQDKHVGTFGLVGNFSFYPTKQITTGEGGMIITSDDDVMKFVTKYKAFGIDTPPELRNKPGVYDVRGLGYNYRMTDIQAALAVGQMERYGENLMKRQANAKLLTELLQNHEFFDIPEYSTDNSYFIFQLLIKNPSLRDRILLGLKEFKIGVSIHYATPVPLMTYYREKYGYKTKDFPNAVSYGKQVLSLPVHSNLSYEDIKYIAEKVIRLASHSRYSY